jgi:hypothetical protein
MGILGRAPRSTLISILVPLMLLLPPSLVSAGLQGSNGDGWKDLKIYSESVALCKEDSFDTTDPLADCKRHVDGERAGNLVFKGGISMRTGEGDPETRSVQQ